MGSLHKRRKTFDPYPTSVSCTPKIHDSFRQRLRQDLSDDWFTLQWARRPPVGPFTGDAMAGGLTSSTRACDTAPMDTSRRSFLTSLGTLAAAPLLARDYGSGGAPVR